MNFFKISFSVFLLSFILSYLITPLIIKFSENKKIGISHPDHRKIHKKPVSQIGGIAIYISFLIAILIFTKFERQLFTIIFSASIVFLLGLKDDLKEIPAIIKLVVQIISAILLIISGVKINFLSNPFGEIIYLGIFSIPVTLLWIVGIINALNFIDGLDGLACGISIISGIIFFLLSIVMEKTEINLFILSSAVIGSCAGFLRYNFHPAKIFMGDCGAYFLGFILSSIAIIGAFKSVATLAILAPVLILGIPILDVILSIIRRIKKGESTFTPDKEHLHHKLLEMGLSQRQTVLLIYLANLILGAIALILVK